MNRRIENQTTVVVQEGYLIYDFVLQIGAT